LGFGELGGSDLATGGVALTMVEILVLGRWKITAAR
jgi:hypothetical protein